MKKTSPIRKFLRMAGAVRNAATAEFDREFVADTFGALSPAGRRAWRKAKRKRGRPRVGAGAERVSVTIERALLKKADREAKGLGVSRAQLIARGLKAVMGEGRRAA